MQQLENTKPWNNAIVLPAILDTAQEHELRGEIITAPSCVIETWAKMLRLECINWSYFPITELKGSLFWSH